MKSLNYHRKSILLFYILIIYILLQIIWWVYQIIDLAKKIDNSGGLASIKIKMIAGEFAVFFLLLVTGVWYIRKVFITETKLAENKKNFSLSITHELKTPITASKLLVETLLNRDLPPEKVKELLEKVENEQNRLHELIEKVLLASRLDTTTIQLTLQEIPVLDFLKEHTSKLNAPNKIEFQVNPSDTFRIDPFLFASVIQNLHENAIKYSPEQTPIGWKFSKNSTFATLSISDFGAGIPLDQHEKVFEVYYRLDNEETKSSKGTGIGLYLVKKIVDFHQGKISIKNNVPHGTIIEINLPILK
jgi:two-component system phosphate regulon sensor histidine kinase PhoR